MDGFLQGAHDIGKEQNGLHELLLTLPLECLGGYP